MLLEILIVPVILVVRFFIKHDSGPKEPKKALRLTILFGILAIILAIGISYLLEYFKIAADPLKISGPGFSLLASVIIFALVEEAAKFLPMAFWLRSKPYFEEVTDGVIYFALVGFTFGTIENLLYAGSYGSGVGILRMVMMLYFHGAVSAIVGYFFAKGIIYKKRWTDGLIALAGAACLHGIYNYCAFSAGSGDIWLVFALLLSATLNSLMFWLFYKAQVTDYNNFYLDGKPVIATPQQAPQSTVVVSSNTPVVNAPAAIMYHPTSSTNGVGLNKY
jgi:protease PrsW